MTNRSPGGPESAAHQGVEPDYQGSAELAPFIARELKSWARVVREGNIKLQ